MHDDAISQAEIDALVRGMTGQRQLSAPARGGLGDTAILQEPLRDFASSSGRALTDLVGVPCRGNLAELTATTYQGVDGLSAGQMLVGRTNLNNGLIGPLYYVLPVSLGLAMITQIYGGVAPSALDDSALSALADGLTQMNRVGLSKLAELLGHPVFAEAVEVLAGSSVAGLVGEGAGSSVVAVGFDLEVGEDSGRILLVLPEELAATLTQAVKDQQEKKARPQGLGMSPAFGGASTTSPVAVTPTAVMAPVEAAVASALAHFPDMAPRAVREETRNIDMLMDVTLQVTVELGRTRRQIRDVLALGPGSVLELERLAGEPVDVLVNGKLIARGEVVVMDENFGVRLTDIISAVDRVKSLK